MWDEYSHYFRILLQDSLNGHDQLLTLNYNDVLAMQKSRNYVLEGKSYNVKPRYTWEKPFEIQNLQIQDKTNNFLDNIKRDSSKITEAFKKENVPILEQLQIRQNMADSGQIPVHQQVQQYLNYLNGEAPEIVKIATNPIVNTVNYGIDVVDGLTGMVQSAADNSIVGVGYEALKLLKNSVLYGVNMIPTMLVYYAAKKTLGQFKQTRAAFSGQNLTKQDVLKTMQHKIDNLLLAGKDNATKLYDQHKQKAFEKANQLLNKGKNSLQQYIKDKVGVNSAQSIQMRKIMNSVNTMQTQYEKQKGKLDQLKANSSTINQFSLKKRQLQNRMKSMKNEQNQVLAKIKQTTKAANQKTNRQKLDDYRQMMRKKGLSKITQARDDLSQYQVLKKKQKVDNMGDIQKMKMKSLVGQLSNQGINQNLSKPMTLMENNKNPSAKLISNITKRNFVQQKI